MESYQAARRHKLIYINNKKKEKYLFAKNINNILFNLNKTLK